MMQICCPWCGNRDEPEFACGGSAQLQRPAPTADAAAWGRYLFFRENPRGISLERWRHTFGCGQWFNLVRDTTTHEIVQVYKLSELPD